MMKYRTLSDLVPTSAGTEPDWSALLDILPSLRPLMTTPQDPVYHAEGDVWTHTKMVLSELLGQASFWQCDEETRFVRFVAALLHDISKPDCTVVEPSGRVSSAGHSRRGAVDARVLLWQAAVPFALRERICRVIALHQVPFFVFSDRAGRRPEFLVHALSWQADLRDLHAVAEADMRGRSYIGQADSLADVALFAQLAQEEQCWTGPRAFPDDVTRQQYFRSDGGISPDFPFYQPDGAEVILLCGLPASGKNRWIQQQASDWPTVSYDDIRAEMGLKHGKNEGAVTHRALDLVKEHLRKRERFVWNATHLSQDMRSRALDLLYAYHVRVRIVYLETDEKTLRDRNRRRDSTVTNRVIDRLLFKWETPLPWEAHRVDYVVEG